MCRRSRIRTRRRVLRLRWIHIFGLPGVFELVLGLKIVVRSREDNGRRRRCGCWCEGMVRSRNAVRSRGAPEQRHIGGMRRNFAGVVPEWILSAIWITGRDLWPRHRLFTVFFWRRPPLAAASHDEEAD